MDNHKMTDLMIRYEQTGLGEDETIELFQYLVDTGMAWTLQGFYGRQAMALIEMGLVTRPTKPKASEAIRDASGKPKLKRGRKPTKIIGALVQMSQRRNPGHGIIVDRIEGVEPEDLIYKYRIGMDDPLISNTLKEMKKKGHAGWGVINNEKHSDFVLVHWLENPSEYMDDKQRHKIAWYPAKWVKVISAVKKKEN